MSPFLITLEYFSKKAHAFSLSHTQDRQQHTRDVCPWSWNTPGKRKCAHIHSFSEKEWHACMLENTHTLVFFAILESRGGAFECIQTETPHTHAHERAHPHPHTCTHARTHTWAPNILAVIFIGSTQCALHDEESSRVTHERQTCQFVVEAEMSLCRASSTKFIHL